MLMYIQVLLIAVPFGIGVGEILIGLYDLLERKIKDGKIIGKEMKVIDGFVCEVETYENTEYITIFLYERP